MAPWPAYPLPRWIAHRGGGALAPENTLAGIELAARLGYRAVEFDVMLSADGVPVLIHDETLERTTNGHGPVAALPWSVLAGLDAGSSLHPAYAGVGIPRLEEALARCQTLGLAINLELKPALGHEVETALAVARLLARPGPITPLLVSSFSVPALVTLADALPSQARALLVDEVPGHWAEALAATGARALHCSSRALLAGQAAPVLAAGVPVAVYTVNDPLLADACWAAGARALFSDRLDRLGP